MNRSTARQYVTRIRQPPPVEDTATAYNQAADAYIAYADGDPDQLFAFKGPHAYADRRVWLVLAAKLHALRATGATSIHILDAGCGPGTWLRRLVLAAKALGFTTITARGFDLAAVQIKAARRGAYALRRIPGLDLTFVVANLQDRLPEADASVDITLCLYSVLSHLALPTLPAAIAELSRVTRGHFVTTVRSIGSTPTIFVDSIEAARRFELDHESDRCEIEFHDGRRLALRFHLFTPQELQRTVGSQFEIEDLRGLDIFHGRFGLDERWNPVEAAFDPRFTALVSQLEERFAHHPSFMERATHLMLVGRRRLPS
ncbi:MAG TPA: class I SAM-dependent methyltransferase [Acetobacteraceae bacterium]|jgi:SAM-dependent methyltransferase|nr:class I SAM-dependent methyltransferase [Acetobacteraceae bacterium]